MDGDPTAPTGTAMATDGDSDGTDGATPTATDGGTPTARRLTPLERRHADRRGSRAVPASGRARARRPRRRCRRVHRASRCSAGRWSPAGGDVGRSSRRAELWDGAADRRHSGRPSSGSCVTAPRWPPGDTCRRAGVGHRTIDDVIQPNRVLELHDEGATVVLQGLQLSDPHLARARQQPGAGARPAGAGERLPLAAGGPGASSCTSTSTTSSSSSSKGASAGGCGIRSSAPATRCAAGPGRRRRRSTSSASRGSTSRCDAGDCLYLPRGLPHAAETVDAASAHLTIGVLAVVVAAGAAPAVDAAVADGRAGGRRSRRGAVPDAPTSPARRPHLDPPPCGAGWPRRCGGASRRPACARGTRRRSTHRRQWTLTPGPLVWLERPPGRASSSASATARCRCRRRPHGFLAEVLRRAGPLDARTISAAASTPRRSLVVGRRLAAEGVVAPG